MPSKTKALHGNPSKRKQKTAEAQPPPGATPPKHLDKAAKEEWRRISKLLLDLGLLTKLDQAALAAYCVAYSRWVEAEKQVQKHGLIFKAQSGYPMYSPYLNIANRAMKQMREFLSEFGMSPSSRTRVSVVEPSQQNDPFTVFEGGKK